MPNNKSVLDSLQTLGLREYLERNYREYGGYGRYKEMVKAGYTDTSIGKHFKRSKQAVGPWRKQYLAEQEGK